LTLFEYVTSQGRTLNGHYSWSEGYWAREWLCAHYATVLDQSNTTLQSKGGRMLINTHIHEKLNDIECL